MKSITRVLLVVCAVAALGLCACGDRTPKKPVEIFGLRYKLYKSGWAIVLSSPDAPETVYIPDQVMYKDRAYKVNKIARGAFKESNIKSVRLSNNIKELPDSCFYRCYDLISVELPGHLKTIGKRCFKSCISLTAIEFPQTLQRIEEEGFSSCALESVRLPNSVKNIGNFCFFYCWNLTSATLSRGLDFVSYGCFEDCAKLVELDIPDSTTQYLSQCLYNCYKLENIKKTTDGRDIPDYCFELFGQSRNTTDSQTQTTTTNQSPKQKKYVPSKSYDDYDDDDDDNYFDDGDIEDAIEDAIEEYTTTGYSHKSISGNVKYR